MRSFARHQPNRQYVFRRRGDRQRIALRLAHGIAPAQVAAVERMRPFEVLMLLGDEQFGDLVQAHAALLGRSPEERLAKLTELALDLLQLALVAGDVRVAIFFASEQRAGRDPSRALAEAVEAAMQRHGLAARGDEARDPASSVSRHPPAGPAGQPLPGTAAVADRLQPHPPTESGGDEVSGSTEPFGTDWHPGRPLSRAERCLLPDQPSAMAPRAPRRVEADFPYCAATQPTAEAAVALMAEQAAKVEANHRATLHGLAGRLLVELERERTALPDLPGGPHRTSPICHGRGDHGIPPHRSAASQAPPPNRSAPPAPRPHELAPPAPSPAVRWERVGVRACAGLDPEVGVTEIPRDPFDTG